MSFCPEKFEIKIFSNIEIVDLNVSLNENEHQFKNKPLTPDAIEQSYCKIFISAYLICVNVIEKYINSLFKDCNTIRQRIIRPFAFCIYI